jgi:hypothetical protein
LWFSRLSSGCFMQRTLWKQTFAWLINEHSVCSLNVLEWGDLGSYILLSADSMIYWNHVACVSNTPISSVILQDKKAFEASHIFNFFCYCGERFCGPPRPIHWVWNATLTTELNWNFIYFPPLKINRQHLHNPSGIRSW